VNRSVVGQLRPKSCLLSAESGADVQQLVPGGAATLSDDDRLARHILSRPGCPFYRRDSFPLTPRLG